MKGYAIAASLACALSATSVFAQTAAQQPKPAQPPATAQPKPAQPTATPPPAPATPAPPAPPPPPVPGRGQDRVLPTGSRVPEFFGRQGLARPCAGARPEEADRERRQSEAAPG